ncbi:MAG: serine/threonine-protein phosphatase [Phycisphaerae bacterium]|nr:serine/threonine-protein phosphatase [Phycisphaerae bacterium]
MAGGSYIALSRDLGGAQSNETDSSGIVAPAGMDLEELLLQLLAPMQHLSTVRDPHELFRLGAVYASDGPVSDEPHAMLVVSTAGLDKGDFRVTRKLLSIPRRRSSVEVAEDDGRVEPQRGGFIGSILRRRQPELIRDLNLGSDPIIGRELADFDSCLLLPLFSGGKMCKRVLVFRRRWSEVEFADVERALLILNLIESAIENITTAQRNADLARALDMQFEQVSRLQRRMLPRPHPDRPGIWHGATGGVEIGMHYQPCERAGGDYFNFFPLPDGRLMLIVADVAGHGADAAMIMGMLHAILSSDAPLASGPAELLTYANRRLLPLMVEGRFVTAVAAMLDPASRVVTYSSAGHPAPRLVNPAAASITPLDGALGDVLGLLDDAQYPEAQARLGPGARVVFYTDGLTDMLATGSDGRGAERLDSILVPLGPASPADLAVRLVDAAMDGAEGGKAIDDITVVTLSLR